MGKRKKRGKGSKTRPLSLVRRPCLYPDAATILHHVLRYLWVTIVAEEMPNVSKVNMVRLLT